MKAGVRRENAVKLTHAINLINEVFPEAKIIGGGEINPRPKRSCHQKCHHSKNGPNYGKCMGNSDNVGGRGVF